jgi:hypothetical protein
MPVRFSLRSFFLFAAVVAVICAWCVLPSMAARRFVRAVEMREYKAADEMFRNAEDRCLEKWDEECWSFRAAGRLAPVTLGQLLSGRRLVEFNINYFALDQTVSRNALIAVTPLGAKTPEVGPERYGSMIIDGIPNTAPIERYTPPVIVR